jgi:hypothetical protein
MRHDLAGPPVLIAVSLALVAPLAIGLLVLARSPPPRSGWQGASVENLSHEPAVRAGGADRVSGPAAVEVRSVPDADDDGYVEELLRILHQERPAGAVSSR